ncbi:MAG: hypothetical protein GY842_14430 [bacterium]|nr:hypothetical protein [bacterium]
MICQLGAVLLSVCMGVGDGPRPAPVAIKEFRPVGRLDTKVIRESSGIGQSGKHPGVFWTHSDSGNPAALYAIKADGELLATIPVTGAPNLDWEDLAVANGCIYVGDIGNNYGWLRGRIIYRFTEPDPHANPIKPIAPTATYRYVYPDKPFDAEALVVRGEDLFVIRKTGGKDSAIYHLSPATEGRMQLARIQSLQARWITGADLSKDGRYLVTASAYQVVRHPVNADLTLREDEPIRTVRIPRVGELEACCFDGDDVLLTTEQGGVYRIPASDIEEQTRFVTRLSKTDH